MKILHVITGLGNGGAEGALYRLCAETAGSEMQMCVISFISGGMYCEKLRALGVEVFELNSKSIKDLPRVFFFVSKIIKRIRPDVVQTWMYHADLLGGLAAKILRVRRIVWGVRHSNLGIRHNKIGTLLVAGACAMISWVVPDKIVCCAESAAASHRKIGYRASRIIVVPNGYDFSRLGVNNELRKTFRREISVSEDEFLIGMVARYSPQKDHQNLLRALRLLRERDGLVFKCVLVGPGVDSQNCTLVESIKSLGLDEDVILKGAEYDIAKVMNGLDLHVLSSLGEAFPNVIAEAMACEVPCVSTDVGDAKLIVGECGWITPPRNSAGLAAAMRSAFYVRSSAAAEWVAVKRSARARVVEMFSIDSMVKGYRRAWFY